MHPHMLPLGYRQPPNDVHAVSVSMPTWDSVTGWGRREDDVVGKMQTVYPRLYLHKIVQALADAARARLLPALPKDARCMVFPSERAAERFVFEMRSETRALGVQLDFLESVCFALPGDLASSSGLGLGENRWCTFHAVFYPGDEAAVQTAASKCWCILGDGISSRHAEFCLERVEFMETLSSNPKYRTAPTVSLSPGQLPAVPWTNSANESKQTVKRSMQDWPAQTTSQDSVSTTSSYIQRAWLVSTLSRGSSARVHQYEMERSLKLLWSYAETPKCLPMNNFSMTMYHRGSIQELDELEASLKSGRRIEILFCEIPSNPLLETIDIERITNLADRYDFIVACDQTLSGFVNLDLLPFVDNLMDSLTKVFSGASNVMDGSVILNPHSKHHKTLHALLTADFEDTFFPLDAQILATNSADFEERIHQCNTNAAALATLLQAHPSVKKIYYPSMVGSAPLYEKCRRRNNKNPASEAEAEAGSESGQEGGYGFLLSILFHDPSSAISFYDALDVCKGPSIGTNFTLAVPYAQLAHFRELEWATECGVDREIVRISAGLEDTGVLVERVRGPLGSVESLERERERDMGRGERQARI